ncbi:hypothetical protein LAV73_06515 [Lysinibacillus xylanilyticus]|uniref:hypothetical protein n=1 Tax=Lysinibacillus xylanilyticus TaxID=582475 RepID=UPI002B243B79|nr:hypothetical protein [Lysinibacillus xylanilyticus]MEB2279653.1 hypothetical protein [Lysinibacillus xylanilyticus]
MVLNNGFKDVYDPEYYMEFEGHDIRIAITKMKSFIETFNLANISLTYTNKDEYNNSDDMNIAFLRKSHVRHSVLDLNNCFDLLLQIPWFYFRIWESFNDGGNLRSRELNNKISRNTKNWVFKAEKSCTYEKVMKYFENQGNPKLTDLKKKFNSFEKNYIIKNRKNFTIRTLSNQMKHNHSLNFKEFYIQNDMNVNINGEVVNLKRNGIGLSHELIFAEANDSNTEAIELGKMSVTYIDDLKIDIQYNNGEKFFADDYLRLNNQVSIDEVYSEAINYGNALKDLFDELFIELECLLQNNPYFPSQPKITTNRKFNLDEHYKGDN